MLGNIKSLVHYITQKTKLRKCMYKLIELTTKINTFISFVGLIFNSTLDFFIFHFSHLQCN